MTEWRLFPDGTVPAFTTLEFFRNHAWVPPWGQAGHAERTGMVGALIRSLVGGEMPNVDPPASWTDLGCGDGSLLLSLRDLPVVARGYDAGRQNVIQAQVEGLDVRGADILRVDEFDEAGLVSACDVVEHLVDPHGWLAAVPSRLLAISSPSAETDEWHYVHHAWAWDVDGYRALVEGAGWTVLLQAETDAPATVHGGVVRPQRFQAIVAERADR